MAAAGRQFWEITNGAGELMWLGFTRPQGRTELERKTVWTLIPQKRTFVANWFVSEAWPVEGGELVFEGINIECARTVALEMPKPSADVLARINRPERLLTLDQVDSHHVVTVLGKRADAALWARR